MSMIADGEIVHFDNVGLRYGTEREVLSDLTFTLFAGRFYFLTGASGAGKTSLLRLLYLAQRPSRGAIRMFGTDAITLPRSRLPGLRRRIGVVFQDFRLIPHLSAFDNVALPLRVAGHQERDIGGPVRDILEWVGLADKMDARPATLSGGERDGGHGHHDRDDPGHRPGHAGLRDQFRAAHAQSAPAKFRPTQSGPARKAPAPRTSARRLPARHDGPALAHAGLRGG